MSVRPSVILSTGRIFTKFDIWVCLRKPSENVWTRMTDILREDQYTFLREDQYTFLREDQYNSLREDQYNFLREYQYTFCT